MKKIVLSLVAILGIGAAYAQCTPDTTYDGMPGIYPDTIQNLPYGYTGTAYDEVITAVVAADTVVDIGLGSPISVQIDNIAITSIDGLPANFTYECTPSNCELPGGQSSCINLLSTSNPTASDIGDYPLTIYLTTTVNTVIGPQTQEDTLTGYVVRIYDQAQMSIAEFSDVVSAVTAVPNPANENVSIRFTSQVVSEVSLKISNMIGQEVTSRQFQCIKGQNRVDLATEQLDSGIYFYTLQIADKKLSKRLVIKH